MGIGILFTLPKNNWLVCDIMTHGFFIPMVYVNFILRSRQCYSNDCKGLITTYVCTNVPVSS